MVYPEEAWEKKLEGVVVLSFNVYKNGAIGDVNVSRASSDIFIPEAKRLLGLLLWFPEIWVTEAVDSRQDLKIEFDFRKYKKWVNKRGYHQHPVYFENSDSSLSLYNLEELSIPPVPQFKDSTDNLSTYISKNLKYPEPAFRQSIHGTVKVEFVIEVSGNTSNVRALKTLGGGCTEEALRLVRTIRWKPGTLEGKGVRSIQQIAVTFSLPIQNR